jgi:multimeric flavodoxin WrbA
MFIRYNIVQRNVRSLIKMKTMIINGSPRKEGNTAALINEMKKYLKGEIAEISAYYDGIAPCTDCRYCWENAQCAIRDKMDLIYKDDFDNIVIASPIHMSNLTGPLVSAAGRLQVYYASKKFLNNKIRIKRKNGILILTGGGDGVVDCAVKTAYGMFGLMNASHISENMVFSLNTDILPAQKDVEAIEKVKKIALKLNVKNN